LAQGRPGRSARRPAARRAMAASQASSRHGSRLTDIVQIATGSISPHAAGAGGQQEERRGSFDLWLAASQGKTREVLDVIDELKKRNDDVHLDWVLPDTDQHAIWYKNRPLCCQPLHAAVALRHHKGCTVGCDCREYAQGRDRDAVTGSGGREGAYRECAYGTVKALLQAGARLDATAKIKTGGETRRLQAIHIAAGTGNVECLKLLIRSRAEPDAEATKNRERHYVPIHDAVWFNKVRAMEVLISSKASPDAKNNEGNTALHLAAMLGHVDVVQALVGVRRETEPNARKEYELLAQVGNNDGKRPIDLAVERGQFPPRRLYIFTDVLDNDSKVRAFLKVARTCPDAAPALLRNNRDRDAENDLTITQDWKDTLQRSALRVEDFSALLEDAPQAAVDLLDCLTAVPEQISPEHNPLPVRADIPVSQLAYRLLCRYELDFAWCWSPDGGAKHWHRELAPCVHGGQEVQIKVLLLKGILNLEFTHCLAVSHDMRIFSRLAIHGLLTFMWSSFRILFLIDITHECLAMAVISFWIVSGEFERPHDFLRCALWCFVASQGLMECFTFLWTTVRCLQILGRAKLLHFLSRYWHRALIGCLTFDLAVKTSAKLGPDGTSDIALALNGLFHWLLLLFELRAFEWTGKRLLPIMKSVMPITGMLVIMLFVCLGFLHAFWAIDRDNINLTSLFHILVLLFTGEHYLSGEDLEAMEPQKRYILIVLSTVGIFVFLTCALNVFIAVLGDCYDHEQERMICTFQKERAKICSGFFLRPSIHCPIDWEGRTPAQKYLICIGIPVALAVFYAAVLGLAVVLGVSPWVPVIVLDTILLVAQCLLRSALTVRWKERYLWMCHEANIDEELFMALDDRDSIEHHGRIARIKKYMREQVSILGQTFKEIEGTLQDTREDLRERIDSLEGITFGLAQGHSVGPPAEEVPPPTNLEALTDPATPDFYRGAGGSSGDFSRKWREIALVKDQLADMHRQMDEHCRTQKSLEDTCNNIRSHLHEMVLTSRTGDVGVSTSIDLTPLPSPRRPRPQCLDLS